MKPLISLVVNRPISTLMCFTALIIFGFIAASDLSVEFLPEVHVPKLVVTAAYPGLPPAQVKELLTVPLEDSLSSVKGVKGVFSVSREGFCTLELEFHWGTDMTMAAVETREAIDLVYPSLPSDSKKPVVLPINPGEEPLVWVGVFPVSGDLALARRMADREIKTRLQQVEGVGLIALLGGAREEIKIDVDLGRSLGRGVTLDAVAQALAMTNYDFPAGSFREGGTEFLVKTEGRFASESEISGLVVGRTEQGNRVTLSDVAAVSRGRHEPESLFQLNGRDGVALLVRRKSGANPVRVADNIRKEVESLRLSYGKDLEFQTAKDASRAISASISDLANSAVLGAAIAFVVILFFIRRLSTSLILISTLPIATLATLLLLRVSGCSLNTMSLGGLAMGIGMIVDNSVVVLENLERRLPAPQDRTPRLIIAYTAEMAGSTFGSTVTTLIVFMPIIFLPGMVGALFKDLALSITFSQIISFIISVTLVPVLCLLTRNLPRPLPQQRHTIRVKPEKPKARRRRPFFTALERLYRRALRLSLRRPVLSLLFVAGVFAAGFVLLLGLRFEFMPAVDTGEIDVTAALPPGTSLEYLDRVGKALAEEAGQSGLIGAVLMRAGGESDDPYFLSDPSETPEKLHLVLKLKDGAGSAQRAVDELRERLRVPGAEMTFSLPDDIIAPLLGVRGDRTVLLVRGSDQDAAMKNALETSRTLAASDFFSAVSVLPRRNKPIVNLYPKRDILLRDGLSLAAVSGSVRGCLDGLYPSRFESGGREIDMRVRLREEDRLDLERLADMGILTPQGGRVRLGDCLTLRGEKDFSCLIRKDKADVAYMELAPRPERRDGAGRYLRESVLAEGKAESLAQSAFESNLPRIVLIFALALLLLYLVLGAQFESFTLPLFMMISLPLAFSGIVIALVVFGKSVNLSSCLGILVLLGVVVSNSIILFENYKSKLRAGCRLSYAVYRGSAERLKAIMISVATTVTALLPVAIDPLNKSSQSPMAVAILGGLCVSTFLTLFVTPLIFTAYFRRKKP
ncbi:MAG: efflux RND transporter permease subunit [Spirochaetales bacterium]|nr:efflux RND transporter permease subunit [Spirochaetales bacterium]